MTVTLRQFLTTPEIVLAKKMYDGDRHHYARLVCEKIIQPNIERINVSLGQENDPMYLAYAVEYAMSQL